MRKSGKPTVLVANKSEGSAGEAGRLDAYALGLGDPVAISAEHNEGLADLYDALARGAGANETAGRRSRRAARPRERHPIRVAIVGRPNAGKSTLVNRLLGEERLLTAPEAGTTRDAIAVDVEWRGRKFHIHDTAGMRRRARVDEKLEKLSVADALNAVRFAEVVVVLLDVGERLRGAGPAHRRSRRAGRPRAGDRGEQMGPAGTDRRRHRQVARRRPTRSSRR